MAAVQPEIMETPKSYWQIRRRDGHGDVWFGYWRELFQNEVDAGAKNISITVGEADGKGSFGLEPNADRVIRVTFSGDGKGMDEEVIRKVFLKPGESTKRGTKQQGGFGTARIMLCFSQVRYGIRTQDMVVEGDGSKYTCMKHADAVEAKRAELAAAEAALADDAPDAARAVRQARADLAALQAEPGHVHGARFEIDIDPHEFGPDQSWRNPTVGHLLSKLDDYLSMSQLSCKVTVNGEAAEAKALRGPAKRKLVATLPDGTEQEFGTIHTSQGERARHKGKIVVRSNGAAMFVRPTSTSTQVIVELDPALSKQVLTDNRDSMREPWRTALDGFVEQLVVDTTSALEDKDNRRHIVVKGGRGRLRAALARVDIGRIRLKADGEPAAAPKELPKARYVTKEEYRVEGWGGAPAAVVDRLIDAVAKGEETLLDGIEGHDEAKARFVEAVRTEGGPDALKEVDEPLAELIAAALVERVIDAGVDPAEAAKAAKFADLHDVHIQIDDADGDERLKNAARRFNPGYWRRKGESLEGRGLEAHMLYAAWTACVEHAFKAILAAAPSLAPQGGVDYATGWYFGKSKDRWVGDEFKKVRTAAQHQERDGTHLLLLNPIFEDAQPAFTLNKLRRTNPAEGGGGEEQMGVQDLVALAVHEVTHVFRKKHDEEFASLMTTAMGLFDHAAAFAAMREAVDTARAAYGRGRSRIQSLDGEAVAAVLDAEEDARKAPAAPAQAAPAAEGEGGEKPAKAPRARGRRDPRPAERLLAHAAPVATMVVGAGLAPENEGVPMDAAKDAYAGAFSDLGGGVTEVDCDALRALDQGLAEAARAGWELPLGNEAEPLGLTDDAEAAPAGVPDLSGLDAALGALAGNAPASVSAPSGEGYLFKDDPRQIGMFEAPAAAEAPPLAGLSGLADLAAYATPVAGEAAPGAASEGTAEDALGFPDEAPAAPFGHAPLLGEAFDLSDFGEEVEAPALRH